MQSIPGLVITPPPPPRALIDVDTTQQGDKVAAERAPQMAQISENSRNMVEEYRRQNEELRNMAPAAIAAIAPRATGAPSAPLSPAPTSEPVTRKSGFLTPSTGEQQPSRELAEVDATPTTEAKAKLEASKRASAAHADRKRARADLDRAAQGAISADPPVIMRELLAAKKPSVQAPAAAAPSTGPTAKVARTDIDCAPHCNPGLMPGGEPHTAQMQLGRVNDALAKQRDATDRVVADLAQAGAKIPPANQTYLGIDNTNSATRFGFRGDAGISTPQQTLTTAEQLLADLRDKTERGEFDRTRLAEFEQKVQHQRTQIAALQQEQERALRAAQEQRDRFEKLEHNPIKKVADEPVSTFSLDVDTASYALARRQLNAGRLPRTDSIRVEEFINYFPYNYARPDSIDAPFAPQITVVPAPWNANNKLVHIGVKGYALNDISRPRANLVLLVDISGSMQPSDRLPLLKNAFRMLVDQLRSDDTIGIVTYASGSDIRLMPTRVENRGTIFAAIDSLNAGGSTSGARGLEDAYRLAEANFDKFGVNRIILGTDGDWNVGITNRDQLKDYIERKRETGIFLSILGVGMGNYNDALMQTLARNGNGVAAYIDTLNEARKVLVDEASSSIFPIAKDVKVQIEFNPQTVSEYRLIGYEKRILKREDFNNDKVDAGDVGAGHTVTAIYEITPVNAVAATDPLRYGTNAPVLREPVGMNASEFGFLKLRYKLPKELTSRLISQPIAVGQQMPSFTLAPTDVRFSIAVAAFGQKLRGSPYLKDYRYDDIIALAAEARGDDPFGYRAEFLNLVPTPPYVRTCTDRSCCRRDRESRRRKSRRRVALAHPHPCRRATALYRRPL
jgi:secreted protein with Ig-like and vWFA domain